MHSILIAVIIFSAGVITGYLASIGQLLFASFLARRDMSSQATKCPMGQSLSDGATSGTAKTEVARADDPAVHTEDAQAETSEATPAKRVVHVISCNGMVHTPFCSQSGSKSFTIELCEPCTNSLYRGASAKNKLCTKCK